MLERYAGKRVRIYCDPLTRTKLEGVATIKKVNQLKQDAINADVEFDEDPGEYFERMFLEKDVI